MKKIDVESKNYKLVRGIVDFTAMMGGAGAVDCVCVPMIKGVFEYHFRWMRPVCYLGTYGLSLAAGALSAGAIDELIDNFVDSWNHRVDESDDARSEFNNWISYDCASDNAEARRLFQEALDEQHVMEFATEEEAKAAFIFMHKAMSTGMAIAAENGGEAFVSVAELMQFRGMDPAKVPYSHHMGWTNLDGVGIDKVRDDNYILDAFDNLGWIGVVTFDKVNKEQ